MRPPLSLMLVLALSSCALSPLLPPLDRSLVETMPVPVAAPDTARHRPRDKRLQYEYNAAEDVSRVIVTTHPGRQFLWIRRPQLSFFFAFLGATPQTAPAVVYLVFRTQSPQATLNTQLQLICDRARDISPGLPTYTPSPRAQLFTAADLLTFQLPMPTIRRFSTCQTGDVTVGGVHAPFGPEQFAALRALLGQLP